MKPKVVYGASVNLSGVWGPSKMKYDPDLKDYWDRTGDFSINRIGEHHPHDGIITFASTSRKETLLWVKGVKAAMQMLTNWCKQE